MTQRASSLWPREHGAYAQLGIALAAALALAPSRGGLAQGILTAALFLASEPLLVLLGRRGSTDGRGPAWRRLGWLGAMGAGAGVAAWAGAPASRLLALVPAAILGLGLFGLFLAGRERTAAGEVLAAWTFAAAALAVTAAGAAPSAALALILAAVFSLGTALVHGHLMALRRGGGPTWRLAAFLLGLALAAGAWALAGWGILPRGAGLCLLPMTLAALAIWLVPPAPRRLRAVGWAAAACALAGGGLAVAWLRQPPSRPWPPAAAHGHPGQSPFVPPRG
jgi:hypothetical protein